MTSQPFPRNKVILFALVDQQRQRKEDSKKGRRPEPAIRTFRNPANGTDYNVSLQVAAPYGGSYQLAVEVGAGVPGATLLAEAQAGQPLVLEGYLTRMREVDRRFADYEEELIEGVIYQDVVFQVERLRAHEERDPQGTGSNVWIEGEVAEPPVFMRHPDFGEIELARVALKVRTQAQISEDGRVTPGRPCEVTVIVPTDEAQATYLYRRGNRVRLRGVIERMAMRQTRTPLVRDRVANLEAEFKEQREDLREGDDPRALLKAGNSFLRTKERLERAARTMVLAVEVTPVSGEPLDRTEASAARDEFTKAYRAERRARQEAWKTRQREALQREAAERAATGTGTGVGADAAPAEAPPSTAPRKPRRHVAEQPVAAVPEELALIAVDPLALQVETAVAAIHANGTEPEG